MPIPHPPAAQTRGCPAILPVSPSTIFNCAKQVIEWKSKQFFMTIFYAIWHFVSSKSTDFSVLLCYCTTPFTSTVKVTPLLSLKSLCPAPSSGFTEDLEALEAFWIAPAVLTR